ncbi:hypothetical protein FALB51S_01988 [Frigidibacter albus]
MPCQTTIHSGRKIPLPQKVPPLPEIMFKFYDVDPASGSISEVWPKTSIGVSVSRLVRAALTVGRANWTHVLAHGGKSRLECIWRVAMLLANISRATKGSKSIYSRSEAFDTLDPSEKGAASYFIGGIATQVVAEWLGYSPLLHLDTYTKAVYSTTAITASFHPGPNGRPDFVGLRHDGRYGIFESKGRAQSSNSQLRQTAKTQTQTINKIDGSDPVGRFACITYLGATQLTVEVIDPVSALEGAPDFVPEPGLITSHYTLIASLLEEESQSVIDMDYDGETFQAIEIKELDLFFGVSTSVLKAVRKGDDKAIEKYIRRRNGEENLERPEEQQLSSDGLKEDVESFASRIHRVAKSDEVFPTPDDFAGVTQGVDGHIVFLGQSWKKPRLRRRQFPRPKPEAEG